MLRLHQWFSTLVAYNHLGYFLKSMPSPDFLEESQASEFFEVLQVILMYSQDLDDLNDLFGVSRSNIAHFQPEVEREKGGSRKQ